MPRCAVTHCPHFKRRENEENSNVRCHVFPKKTETRQAWADFVNKANIVGIFKPTPNSGLCSAHFSPECYADSKRLKKTAVPSIIPELTPEAALKLGIIPKLEEFEKIVVEGVPKVVEDLSDEELSRARMDSKIEHSVANDQAYVLQGCDKSKWKKLECSQRDLHLPLTLSGGQSFRWRRNDRDEWTGVFAGRIWILKRDNDHILYRTIGPDVPSSQDKSKKRMRKGNSQSNVTETLSTCQSDDEETLLKSYFRLDTSLEDLYEEWSSKDPNFKEIMGKFFGIRMLKQEPAENLFAFICSSNNNISRISSMVEKLCTMYGPKISSFDGVTYHAFPSTKSLSNPAVDEALRSAGFGYRAKFIQQSAAHIEAFGGDRWLQNLQTMPYEKAKSTLMNLPGIGAKVADCICLMSLNHLQAIPVDTHVWQISCRYLPHLKEYKSVTTKVYNEIGQYFQNLYGPLAGWAHTVLFCADLKKFQESSAPSQAKKKKQDCNTTKAAKKTKCT